MKKEALVETLERKIDILLEQKTLDYATTLTVKELGVLNPGFKPAKLYLIMDRLIEQFSKKYPSEYRKIVYLFGDKRKVIPKWFYEEEMGKEKAPAATDASEKSM